MHVLYVSCRTDDAHALAARLVEERLVACASILPGVESIYRWQGAVERQSESVLVMETAAARVERAIARIEELHGYDVPKIVAFEATLVNTSYEQWVEEETKDR